MSNGNQIPNSPATSCMSQQSSSSSSNYGHNNNNNNHHFNGQNRLSSSSSSSSSLLNHNNHSNNHNNNDNQTVHSLAEYLQQLLKDRQRLAAFPGTFLHIDRLIDAEIARVRASLFQINGDEHKPLILPEPDGPIVNKMEKVYVPVDEHPDFNFVGRILGPRGMTAKQLEQETGCKIMVRGRGSMRDKKKEEQNRGKPNWEHLNDKLHVLITVEDTENRAIAKMERAIEEVKKLLVPITEGEDELKKRQLMELAIINGTYRDSGQRNSARQFAHPAAAAATPLPHQSALVHHLHYGQALLNGNSAAASIPPQLITATSTPDGTLLYTTNVHPSALNPHHPHQTHHHQYAATAAEFHHQYSASLAAAQLLDYQAAAAVAAAGAPVITPEQSGTSVSASTATGSSASSSSATSGGLTTYGS
ncbi:protein held out wings-like [Dermatophagoides farinae]|uniref:Protein held out wings-like n=1 Tax=Dermatophagoides farinae TaxID=6954 RepID=A0A9D4P6B0_DERFA|nr:protein held out wings-like [Dermatophagoides farinae]